MYGIDKAQIMSEDDYGIKYNASLWISDTSEHDTGTYSCIVNTSRLIEESIVVQDYGFYPSIIVSSLTFKYLYSRKDTKSVYDKDLDAISVYEKDDIALLCPHEVALG